MSCAAERQSPPALAMTLPVLYAMRSSLYSAKARSYLVKQRIDYIERPPGDPRYGEQVVPEIGRWILPVLQTDDGRLIQDTADIFDFLDQLVPVERSANPPLGVQRVVSDLFALFGSEGLMRPALHFRWNFDDLNMPFVAEDFGRGLFLPIGGNEDVKSTFNFGPDLATANQAEARAEVSNFAAQRMRKLTVELGVTPETIPEIERSYSEFLALFAAHLETAPYLLGGRPTLGDFSLIGPLYAHLARDAAPAMIMRREAWPVWRWVERMNSPIADTGEYGDVPDELFADDSVPATLRALLEYVGAEFADDLIAHVQFIDQWLADNDEVEAGDVVGGKATRRSLGKTEWTWRGIPMETHVIPYRLLHLQRLQADFEALDSADQAKVREIFAEAGIESFLELRARRRVERDNNREVWGAAQDPVVPV